MAFLDLPWRRLCQQKARRDEVSTSFCCLRDSKRDGRSKIFGAGWRARGHSFPVALVTTLGI